MDSRQRLQRKLGDAAHLDPYAVNKLAATPLNFHNWTLQIRIVDLISKTFVAQTIPAVSFKWNNNVLPPSQLSVDEMRKGLTPQDMHELRTYGKVLPKKPKNLEEYFAHNDTDPCVFGFRPNCSIHIPNGGLHVLEVTVLCKGRQFLAMSQESTGYSWKYDEENKEYSLTLEGDDKLVVILHAHQLKDFSHVIEDAEMATTPKWICERLGGCVL